MKICVSSGKGGVGKTSIVVNLAHCLAEKGKKVLVVDGDLGLANVDVLLGISATKTISDVMDRGADPLEALIRPSDNLAILPASSVPLIWSRWVQKSRNDWVDILTTLAVILMCYWLIQRLVLVHQYYGSMGLWTEVLW